MMNASASEKLSSSALPVTIGSYLIIKRFEVDAGVQKCYIDYKEKDNFLPVIKAYRLKLRKGTDIVMESTEKYMQDLRQWLSDTSDTPLEEMSDFFSNRLEGYEQHMAVWEKSYQCFARLLPGKCHEILDLGCGTGLELDVIWQNNPEIAVTGVDLCQNMLDKLLEKHSDKQLVAVCGDYFQYDFGTDKWDAVISFESLHHFLPERKKELYRKIRHSLKKGGVFLLGDYIACCEEEEKLLRSTYLEKRKRSSIPEDRFVHFDIPLTLEHELNLLQDVGFTIQKTLDDPDEATLIQAVKKR